MSHLEETNSDYTYCGTENCIHRRGCKRWIENYEHQDKAKWWIKPLDCINSKPYPYENLDRFRGSDGSQL